MMILQAIHSQWMFPCMCVHLENIRDGGVIMFVLLLVELLQVWGIFILAVRSHLVSHLSLLPCLKERERMKYYWLCNIIVLIIHLKTLKHASLHTISLFLHLPTSLRQHSRSKSFSKAVTNQTCLMLNIQLWIFSHCRWGYWYNDAEINKNTNSHLNGRYDYMLWPGNVEHLK